MKKSITKSVMVLASTGVMMNMAYVPVPKHKPSADVVATYLDGHRTYNPQKYSNNWNRSEQRKAEILQNINNIRTQIRKQALRVTERAEKHVVDAESYNTYKEKKTYYRASVLVNRAMGHLADIG
jgi:hypothetical protein